MKAFKKLSIYLFMGIISVLSISGCSDDEMPAGNEITFETIAQHYLSTGEALSEQQILIKNQESWEELLSQMNSVNDQSENFKRLDFDFSEEMLLVVIDRFRPNGGHSIEITSLLESGDQISAIIKKPQKGNETTMVMQPYHFISIEKTDKPIQFIKKY